MFNVIRIWSVVRQPICQNQSPDRPVDLWSIFGRQTGSAGRHLRTFQMTKCRPTDDRHNKLSADGQTMIADGQMMIDVGRRTIQRLFQLKKNRPLMQKKLTWPDSFLPQKQSVVDFWKCD